MRGTIVAVRLPNFAPRAGTFYCYLDGMGKINARGVEIYRESRDATSELILFPPVNGSTYKLLHNSATGPGDVRTQPHPLPLTCSGDVRPLGYISDLAWTPSPPITPGLTWD